jgi:hypothetical protein
MVWMSQKFEDEALIAAAGDVVFFEAAKQMRHSSDTSKSRKLVLKMHLGEVVYMGQRHEIWLNRIQIRCRPSDKGLAGYIKSKCLGLK